MSIPRLTATRPVRAGRPVTLGLVVLAAALAGVGCGEDATPVDQVSTTRPPTPHLLEPTGQMEELARQQCLDDPDLAQGEVNAVDPDQPDEQLATVVVDCDEVRAGTDSSVGPGPGEPAAT